MPTFAGEYLSLGTPFPRVTPELSGNRSEYTITRYPNDKLGLSWVTGTFTGNAPISLVSETLVGWNFKAFFHDWYYRVHVRPNPMSLGTILSTQTRDVEVWNAWFVDRSLTVINATNDLGVSLTGPIAPPTVFGKLESRMYEATIQALGPAICDATYEFVFDSESPVLNITGIRSSIFSFRPNWDQPVVERYEFLTDVLTSRNGTEQRVSLRQMPRQQLRYTAMAFEDDYQLMDSLISGWQSRVYVVPMWQDMLHLEADLPAGSTSVTLSKLDASYDFRVDGLAVLGTDARHTEGVQIATIVGTTLTFVKPTDKAWATGTWIVPARNARMRLQQSVSRPTAQLTIAPLMFDFVDYTAMPAAAQPQQYQGLDVYLKSPDRAEDVSVTYNRLAEVIDFGVGSWTVDDIPARPFIARQYRFLYDGRTEIQDLRKFMGTRKGQAVPFWMPAYERNIELVDGTITGIDQSLKVKHQLFTANLQNLSGKQHVAFLYKNGTWYFRQILAWSAFDEDTELMNIDAPFGFDSVPGDWVLVCFLEKVRMAGDGVELAWVTDNIVVTQADVVGVVQ